MRHLGGRIDTNSIYFRIAAVFLLASIGMTAAVGALGYLFLRSQQNLPYFELNPWKIPPLLLQEAEDHEQTDFKALAAKFQPHLFAILDGDRVLFSNIEGVDNPLFILEKGKPVNGPFGFGGGRRGSEYFPIFGTPAGKESAGKPPRRRTWSRKSGRGINFNGSRYFIDSSESLTAIVQDTICKGRKPKAILFATQVAVLWFSMLSVLYLVIRRLLTPLNELLHATVEMGEGNLDYRIDTVARGEFGILIESFNEMARRLSAMFSNSRVLLGNISHDLKYYMTRMKMTVEVDVENQEARDSLNEDLDRLNQYIGRSLEAYKMNSRKIAFKSERIDFSSMVRSRSEAFISGNGIGSPGENADNRANAAKNDPEGAKEHIPVTREITDGIFVTADPAHMSNALDNIFDNAANYGTDMILSLKGDADSFVLTVDNGIDNPPDPGRIDLLFEPFFRGDPSRTQKKSGSGLGLYLAREALDAMGFTISLASYPMKKRFVVNIKGPVDK